MDRPLVITEDSDILDAVLRLTATSGIDVHVVAHADAARGPWPLAPLVLVGADLAPTLATLGLSRRDDVIVVATLHGSDARPPETLWPVALSLGAEHVAALPEGERWLAQRLRAMHEGPSRNGQVLALIGATGGVGVSTTAAGLARVARADGRRVLLIDADPRSPGLDLLLGADAAPGVRWPELGQATGRLSPQTLEQALPVIDGVVVAAPDRRAPAPIAPEVLLSVIDAGVRGFDHVIIDLPRSFDDTTDQVAHVAQRTLFLVANRVVATCAAAMVLDEVRDRMGNLEAVVRQHRNGLDIDLVVNALRVPMAGVLPTSSHIVQGAESGDPPDADDTFAKACRQLLGVEIEEAVA
jgi:secretion/DNA translocation related CpaE-like protein